MKATKKPKKIKTKQKKNKLQKLKTHHFSGY